MAFTVGKTSALQTAVKAAVDIAVAEFNAAAQQGTPLPSILDRVVEIRDFLAPDLFAQVDADNAATAASGGSSGGRSNFAGKATNAVVSEQDARDMVLNFGAFRGLTLGDVAAMSKDEVHSYTSGKMKSDGLSYLTWLANNNDPKAAFAAKRAKVIVNSVGQAAKALSSIGG